MKVVYLGLFLIIIDCCLCVFVIQPTLVYNKGGLRPYGFRPFGFRPFRFRPHGLFSPFRSHIPVINRKNSDQEWKHRIVGGHDITIEELPFICLIMNLEEVAPYCSGNIVGPRHILTMKHCVEKIPAGFKVITGATERKGTDGVVRDVADIVTHPTEDAAVIILTEDIQFNDKEKQIRLGVRVPSQPDNVGVIGGWGRIGGPQGPHANILQKAEVPIFPLDECKQIYPDLRDSEFCAGYKEGGIDACKSDSGGPWAFEGKLVGLISRGKSCAEPNSPGIYLSVPFIKDWIEQHVPPNP